jgi:quinol monooxygenase YgiN
MKFAQIIEFKTSRIDDFHANLDAWMTATEGHRIPHRALLGRDRDAADRSLLMVEFADHRSGRQNSNRPKTSEFAARLAEMSEEPLTFRSLDVLREEDL